MATVWGVQIPSSQHIAFVKIPTSRLHWPLPQSRGITVAMLGLRSPAIDGLEFPSCQTTFSLTPSLLRLRHYAELGAYYVYTGQVAVWSLLNLHTAVPHFGSSAEIIRGISLSIVPSRRRALDVGRRRPNRSTIGALDGERTAVHDLWPIPAKRTRLQHRHDIIHNFLVGRGRPPSVSRLPISGQKRRRPMGRMTTPERPLYFAPRQI
jgi:hypothetical protein